MRWRFRDAVEQYGRLAEGADDALRFVHYRTLANRDPYPFATERFGQRAGLDPLVGHDVGDGDRGFLPLLQGVGLFLDFHLLSYGRFVVCGILTSEQTSKNR